MMQFGNLIRPSKWPKPLLMLTIEEIYSNKFIKNSQSMRKKLVQ